MKQKIAQTKNGEFIPVCENESLITRLWESVSQIRISNLSNGARAALVCLLLTVLIKMLSL